MPRIMIATDGRSKKVIASRSVNLAQLDDEIAAVDLISELASALADAERAEREFAERIAAADGNGAIQPRRSYLDVVG